MSVLSLDGIIKTQRMNEESEKQSAMGDTSDFKGRIDKVFGALFQSDGGWRLSDAQLRKKEWKREESSSAREDTPCGSSFDGLNDMGRPKGRTIKRSGDRNSEWEGDFGDSDDDDDEKEAGEESNVGDKGEDEEEEEGRDIRFVVGMDSTLDHEDEEDEYDKVAVGREDAGERTYMREIMDTGPKINSHNSLPSSLKDLKRAGRDPRANHYAARARLEEDDEEAAAVHPDSEMVDKLSLDIKEDHRKINDDDKENGIKKENETGSLPMEEMQPRTELKSIIKGKKRRTEFLQDMESEPPSLEEASSGPGTCSPMTDSSVEKPQKRVRFDPGINGDPAGQLEKKHDLIKVANSRKRSFVRGVSLSDSVHNGYSRVPDYIRNPSKYIHYTLDWSNEDDDMINTQAFNEFSQLVKPSAPVQVGDSTELPKSVTFIPRKRLLCSNKTREDSNYINNIQNAVEDSSENSNLAAIFPLGIAAGHATEPESPAQGNDIGESEEFGGINKNSRLHKGTRKYRSKADSDEETGA